MIIIGDNFFDGLQVVFGTMLVWSEVSPRDRPASHRGFVRGLSDTQLAALPDPLEADRAPEAGAFPVGGCRTEPHPHPHYPSPGVSNLPSKVPSALEQLVLELLGAGLRGHMVAIFI